MLLRHKLCKSTAIAIAAISVFGSSISTVNAYQGVEQVTQISQEVSKSTLQNGEYKLNNIVKKDNVKPYRGFFAEETKLVVKNNKYYLTFTNTNASSVPEIKVNVNGKDINPTIENKTDSTYDFVVELDSLDSTITMTSLMASMGNHTFIYEVGLNMDSLEVVKLDETQQPETPQEPEVKPDNPQQPENSETEDNEEVEDKEESETENSEYKDGLYNLNNIVTDHKMPEMIRSIFSDKMSIEIKNGKYYVTFNLPNYDYVGKITITVDGKKVSHTQENSKSNKTATLKLEVSSLDSDIKMTMYSPITKKDSVFGVKLDKSTMKLASTNQDTDTSVDSSTNGDNNNSSNNSSSGSNTNNNSTSDIEVENVVAKGKRYSIKNEVSAKSTTSTKMGRKYLNETSKIEEVEGKTYAVLTFTGLNMMNNHRIYVNGSKVSHQVVSKTDNSITVRFLIPSIDADIKVQVYVVPMSFDSEFNVKLLESTKSYEGEFDTTSSLPQTGSLLDSSAMMMAGTLISTGGVLLNRRKKNN